jgi:predicted DNA-binding protein (MmcQ/YjbR family)
MAKDISAAVREVCLSFPKAEEVKSHGSPDFRISGGKTFATYVINHHGDGRVALWVPAPPGAQTLYTEAEPEHYFVPPYVGPRGWLGIHLDHGLDWGRIATHVHEAYRLVAPKALLKDLPPPIEIEPPTKTLDAHVFDPLATKHAKTVLAKLDKLCNKFPEVTDAKQFGTPVWRAGKKVFCGANRYNGRLKLNFWVGPDLQDMLTMDKRYAIPPYMGHNGWITLDVEDTIDWEEVERLLLGSYKHFALKRMLAALEGD